MRPRLLFSLLFFGLASSASANNIIYSDISFGSANVGYIVGTSVGNGYLNAWYAEKFTASASTSATEMDVATYFPGGSADMVVTLGIAAISDGLPGALLGSVNVAAQFNGYSDGIFATPIALTAGTSYFAVFTAPNLADLDYGLIAGTLVGSEYQGQSGSFVSNNAPLFDILSGSSTPEPDTFLGVGCGLLILGLRRKIRTLFQ